MWILTIRAPGKPPQEYNLDPGRNSIGRKSANNITLSDISASRLHAVIHYDKETDKAVIYDMGSTNGTYINRVLLTNPESLKPDDVIRIGGSIINVRQRRTDEIVQNYFSSRQYTRELLLESLDHHAVLMYEVAHQLNTVMDIDTALSEVARLMERAMGADKCEVILAEGLNNLNDLGFPKSIAKSTIEQRTAIVIPDMISDPDHDISHSASLMRIRSAICVPVIFGEDVIALIYMYKTDSSARPFDNQDLQLSVAISHQAALTIQRTRLLKQIQDQQRGRQLLERFLSPQEAEFVLKEYLHVGSLPGLDERKATVLFADIADSTGLAERLGARKFGEILNRYYNFVTEIIFEQCGLVKYAGDGLMAVFGMEEPHPYPEDRAVKAGMKIIQLAKERKFSQDTNVYLGVSINSGIVVGGYTGTQERVEFTVLGDVVNVAFGMQGRARPNRLLIGELTANALSGKYELRDLEPMLIKGRTQPIRIYEILGERRTSSGE